MLRQLGHDGITVAWNNATTKTAVKLKFCFYAVVFNCLTQQLYLTDLKGRVN
jgi:hypothetical protein